jgi:hypothetical protein
MVSISQTYHGPNDLRKRNCTINYRARKIRVMIDLAVYVVEMFVKIPCSQIFKLNLVPIGYVVQKCKG